MNKKEMINLILLGRTNYGKSTICGRLASEYGIIEKREIERAKKHSQALDKEGMEFAFLMDKSLEERQKGITIQLGFIGIELGDKRLNIMDPPGHIEFINNLISGVAGADAAVLVVDVNEFEKIGLDPQVEEHIRISYVFGIDQIIILINKMDKGDYSEEKYLKIKKEISNILEKAGYENAKKFNYIPISAIKGENISTNSDKMKWYKKENLITLLKEFKEPKRYVQGPLRMPILRVFTLPKVGEVLTGRIESGQIKIGDKIMVSPSYGEMKMTAEVSSIEWQHRQVKEAWHGMDVGVALKNKSPTFTKRQIKKGYIMNDLKNELKPIKRFEAEIIILNHPTSIKEGYKPVIYCHQARIPCIIAKIKSRINKEGEELEKDAKSLKKDERAIVEITPLKPFVTEEESKRLKLGRFILRDANVTVVAGKITKILE